MGEYYVIPICFNFIEWIRDNFFSPIIEFTGKIFVEIFMKFLDSMINALFAKIVIILYGLYAALLKVVDIFQEIFNAISGSNFVHYTYTADGVKQTGDGYLTEVLFKMPVVRQVFFRVWGLCVILCFVFLIAAILRCMANLSEDGRSINDVIKSAASTFVLFCVVQVVAFGTLSLSNVVITSTEKAMNYAVGGDGDLKIANAMFAVSAINAGRTGDADKDATNVLGQLLGESGYNPDWSKVEPFYKGEKKYYDIADVSSELLITKIDYISGFICIVFVLKYMTGSVLVFVQRIIMVVLALVIAPFFVALTPLDGGERFRRWKEFFIGTCFSSLGVIMSVKIYLMLIPIFISDNFIYSGTGVLAYMIRLYSVIMLSIAFEKTGDIFNRILSDAHIMSSGEAFAGVVELVKNVKGATNFGKGIGKGKK